MSARRRPSSRPPRSLNVLFIGNSFTARNDLPTLVELLATATDRKLKHRLISVGGASLRTHWNKGEARREIDTGGYDYVVLQEQSTLPVKNTARMHENVRLFDGVIRASGARTALYMTWARKLEPQNQQLITHAYTSIARELGATLIPVGVAWQAFMAKHREPVLHDRDGSHPSLAGSFLAACVVFDALFRYAVTGLDVQIEGVTAEQVQALEAAADAAVAASR